MDHGGVVDGYGRIKHDHAWSLGGIPYWKDLDVQCIDLVVAIELLEFCTQQIHALGRYVIQSFNVCLLDQSKLLKAFHHRKNFTSLNSK